MIGIIVGVIISWLLLYFVEKESILALGFLPIAKRLKQFIIGFLLTAVLCVLAQLLEAFLRSSSWVLNEKIPFLDLVNAFYRDVKAVFTEELIFRGALLFILIRRIGDKKGISISAIAFGVYHWFSMGVLGNVVPMVLIFIGTGLMGYAWAMAFSKNKVNNDTIWTSSGLEFCPQYDILKRPTRSIVIDFQWGNRTGGLGIIAKFCQWADHSSRHRDSLRSCFYKR